MPHSIRARLTLVFLGLAAGPLLIVSFILILENYRTQTANAIALQDEMAAHLSSRVESFLRNIESDLQMLIQIEDILQLEQERQRLVLSIFHSREPAIEDLLLLDKDGQTLSYHSRIKLSIEVSPQPEKDFEAFTLPMSQRVTYYGPVRFVEHSGEPLMIMAVPTIDLDSGYPEGVLIADIRLKEIWDLVAKIRPGQKGSSFIVDSENKIVAHSNPSMVLRGTYFTPPDSNGVQIGLSGQKSILVSQIIHFGDQQFHIFVEGPVIEALAPAIQTAFIMLTILVFALLTASSLGLLTVRRIVKPIEEIATTARAINSGDLSSRVEVETRDEIGDLATAFNTMTAQLNTLIDDLEDRVAERTGELAASNKELEAFAYSVSHDLKAPLRHIDGFMELLQKRTVTTADEKSLHYMETISDAAQKMGLLIENLLSFSRMGRQTMSFKPVNLGALAQEIINDLDPDTINRNIKWNIGDIPLVKGDAAMLRIVLTNLISNAIKYTRPRQQAQIEISSLTHQSSEIIIVIRDNGVGFDMSYVDKLFGVFQRLHHADEFEGTGIGLANVRRIVARHGGRTWAEATLDQGASFYFSLPLSQKGKTNGEL